MNLLKSNIPSSVPAMGTRVRDAEYLSKICVTEKLGSRFLRRQSMEFSWVRRPDGAGKQTHM
ncbi:hypothetical protein L1049_015272 [Liquidambar formosana]|uniref:Uncharacterized protein n=1 Tax=Liquidambar formosana TaxID=63359 RepID=A0AAP0RXN1_LIQFO